MVGEFLKREREALGLTQRDIAERTNLMRQLVDELEREDFHRVAAVIYGRGFIKLYGEALGLAPEKIALLQQDFSTIYNGLSQSPIKIKKEEKPSRARSDADVPEKISIRLKPVEETKPEPAIPETGAGRQHEIEQDCASGEAETEETVTGEAMAPEPPSETEDAGEIVPELSIPVVEPETGEKEEEYDDLFTLTRRILEMRNGDAVSASTDEVLPVVSADEDGPSAAEAALEKISTAAKNIVSGAMRIQSATARRFESLGGALPKFKTVLACAAGVAVLVLLSFAIRMLFVLTDGNGGNVDLMVSPPPPSFYVD